jgi:hypothetical protein
MMEGPVYTGLKVRELFEKIRKPDIWDGAKDFGCPDSSEPSEAV